MRKKITSRFNGVRIIVDDKKKNGVRLDRYFSIRYKVGDKLVEEGFGWESKGFTEKGAFDAVCEIKQNIKNGNGYFSLKEKRAEILKKSEDEKQQLENERIKKVTVDEFFNSTYKSVYLTAKGQDRLEDECSVYNNHIKSVIGHKCFDEISIIEIQTIKNNMLITEGLSSSSYANTLVTIRQLFKKAKIYNHFSGTISFCEVQPPVKDNARQRFLTEEEADYLLYRLKQIKPVLNSCDYEYYHKFKTSKLYEMCATSLFAGLRAGELYKLRVMDINLENRFILVRDPKNKKNRNIPICDKLYDILKQHIENVDGLKRNSLMFPKSNGKIMQEISDQYQRIVDQLGFNDNIIDGRDKVVFHTLRHTFASWLAQRGVPLTVLQKLMGHLTSKMTERYAHLAPNNMAEAIKLLN